MKDWEEELLKLLDEALKQRKEAAYTSDLVYELKKRGYGDLTVYEVGQKMKDWNFPKTRLDKVGLERKRGWLLKEFLLAPLMGRGRKETGEKDFFPDVIGMKCEWEDFDFEKKVPKPCGWTGYVRLKKGEKLIAPEMGENEERIWKKEQPKEEEDRPRCFCIIGGISNRKKSLCVCPKCGHTVCAYRPKEINFAGGEVLFK